MNKRLFDFSNLTAGLEQSVIVAKAIPAQAWREAVLLMRFHGADGTTWGSGAEVRVELFSEGYTDEDPNADFVLEPALATTTMGAADIGDAPTLVLDEAVFDGDPGNLGSHLRVVFTGKQAATAVPMRAYVSLDLSLKA